MTRLEQLEADYREHHAHSRPDGFVFGGDERARVFTQLVGGPGLRVLDLGCRSGALTRAYLDGNDVVGVDVDRQALAEAEKLGIATVWGDVEERIDAPADSFDVVVAGELLEHVRVPARVVDEAWRVLRPGGRFVGSVPNAYRLKNRLAFLAGRAPEPDPTHLQMFSPSDLRKLLRRFENVQFDYIVGRFVALHPRLLANNIAFSARKPR